MNWIRLSVFSAFFVAAGIGSAAAELKSLGTVSLEGTRTASFSEPFAGKVESLALRTKHGLATCTSIRAAFADGSTRDVYRGLVTRESVELPMWDAAPITRLDFACQPDSPGTLIEVQALLGGHEAEWRRHPDWNTRWWYRLAPGERTANAD
jgi:hypothetical protein